MPETAAKPQPRQQGAVVYLRCSGGWKAWAESLAAHDRAGSLSELIDRALASYARDRDFDRASPRR